MLAQKHVGLREGYTKITSGLRRYNTSDRLERIDGVKEVEVLSDSGFTAILNGKPIQARHVRITHNKPLTVYDIEGFGEVVYHAPIDSVSPRESAVDIELTDPVTEGGVAEVTCFERVEERELLSNQTTLRPYKDPRSTVVDGREYLNLDTVRIENLKDGSVKLSLQ